MNTVAELKELPQGDKVPFEAVLVLKRANIRKARNDSEFLMVELGDKSGVFHYVCFANSRLFSFFLNLSEGTVLRVQGSTDHYQNRFSPSLANVEKVPEEEHHRFLENLIECAPVPMEELWAELQNFIKNIGHEKLRSTTADAISQLESAFKSTPGAISMHHAYRSGLLEHTVRMARAAKAVLPLYPEVHADLAMSGILLHDLGKALEYTGDLATKKSRAGHLQGHVVLGYRQVRRAALTCGLEEDLVERLEHIILSHQGELEWGAAVKAATAEAVFVSMIDNLDAKMGMVQYALRSTPEGQEFSDFVPGLGAPVLVK
ncbi:MAG: HD domain-containing protein [Verrucomicrobia bacterium]|jgi:3'-5' exoribonuclease|nr:HD domain-containing protein [Verrucomicrobiota bacterium]